MEQILIELAAKYSWFMTVVMVVGVFRLVFKPLMTFIHAVVSATPSTKDDEALAKVEQSGIYKGLLWVVDYLLSIKLPTKPTV